MPDERWNFNMDEAPQGRVEERKHTDKKGKVITTKTFIKEKIVVASKCEKVFTSWKLENGRWNGFTPETPPIAWWTYPTHPSLEKS